jgi:hypothetical protein
MICIQYIKNKADMNILAGSAAHMMFGSTPLMFAAKYVVLPN